MTAVAALEDRRAELTAERDKLRAARGVAALDDATFDGAPRLAEIETALEALNDADAEGHRRAVAAAENSSRERRQKIRTEVAERDRARHAALKEAQTAMEAAVQAISEFTRLTAEIAVRSAQLDVLPAVTFEQNEVELRLSRLVIGALAPLRSREQGFGIAEWFTTPPALQDWPLVERAATGVAITQLLTEKETMQ